jgi:hypothetical protein
LIALVGGVFVWRTAQEQARIRAKIERMSRTAGDLIVADPSKIHVLALDTGEPLHFAWRVFLPADYELVERNTGARPVGVSAPVSVSSREVILRVRFREDAEGRLNLYATQEHGSSRSGFGGKSLSKVLHGRFDKVLVEQLGTKGPVTVGVDEPLDLLSLKLPPDMDAEVSKEAARQDGLEPQFFRLSFGPEAKKPTTPDEREPMP